MKNKEHSKSKKAWIHAILISKEQIKKRIDIWIRWHLDINITLLNYWTKSAVWIMSLFWQRRRKSSARVSKILKSNPTGKITPSKRQNRFGHIRLWKKLKPKIWNKSNSNKNPNNWVESTFWADARPEIQSCRFLNNRHQWDLMNQQKAQSPSTISSQIVP